VRAGAENGQSGNASYTSVTTSTGPVACRTAVPLRHVTVACPSAPGAGEAEQTYIWQDPETGIWCRALLDMSSPLQITDLKTTSDASLEGIQKSVYQYGYHQQDQWYRDAVQAIEGVRPEFRLVFVDKRPPHPVTVVELDEGAQILGAARNARARRIYAECTRTGNWPGHADGITTISLPRWGETHDAMEYL
ncbi:PD-(D/E)XK nuclease-like domain-containing protein, partial [Streptomyces sp. NPDC055366]